MSKKEFTSFDVSAVVHELRQQISNSRVNNIYQVDPKTFLFKLHRTNTPPLLLVVEAGKRLHLTVYVPEKPLRPPDFCMALRKHLKDAWLRGIEQCEFERIVNIHFEGKTSKFMLALELFGEGNLILVDQTGEILQALVFKHMRDRNILRGETYRPPPAIGKNPLRVSLEELKSIFEAGGNSEVVKTIARALGVGGMYAEEVLARSVVEKNKLCNALTTEEKESIHSNLRSLLSKIIDCKFEPRIILDPSKSHIDAVPFPLKHYEGENFLAFGTFNEALDEYYLHLVANRRASELDGKLVELHKEVEKLKRIIAEQDKSLKEALVKAELEKTIGDTIYAYSTQLQQLLNAFLRGKENGKEWNAVAKDIFTAKLWSGEDGLLLESFDARNLAIRVRLHGISFGLGLRQSLFENAASFYDRSKKLRQKATGVAAAFEVSQTKLVETTRLIRETENAETVEPAEVIAELSKHKVKQKEWYERFRWFRSSEGLLVVAGKDSVSNEVLVKKYAKGDDVVFHAEITGAPFAVVKVEGKTPSEQTLHEAAEFAAAFSRGWREGLATLDVFCVKPEQLSKRGPPGEYVPHGSFAVVGKRSWLRGVPLILAIGVVEDDDLEFVGGPVNAVRARTKTYVTLKPGASTGKQLLKKVLLVLGLRASKEKREKVVRTSIEQIREFVPYSRGMVTEENLKRQD